MSFEKKHRRRISLRRSVTKPELISEFFVVCALIYDELIYSVFVRHRNEITSTVRRTWLNANVISNNDRMRDPISVL